MPQYDFAKSGLISGMGMCIGRHNGLLSFVKPMNTSPCGCVLLVSELRLDTIEHSLLLYVWACIVGLPVCLLPSKMFFVYVAHLQTIECDGRCALTVSMSHGIGHDLSVHPCARVYIILTLSFLSRRSIQKSKPPSYNSHNVGQSGCRPRYLPQPRRAGGVCVCERLSLVGCREGPS